MKQLLLRPAAKRDLIGIRTSTIRIWGKQKAIDYLSEIEACFGRISAQPERGASFPTDVGNYRRAKSGSHYIFYRNEPEVVAIIRILHERMDFGRHVT